MQRTDSRRRTDAPPGIFDTIAGAMSAVLAQPYLLLVPIVVDLYLWLGVRLSPAPLTDAMARLMDDSNTEGSVQVAEDMRRWSDQGDMTTLVGLFVPSVLSAVSQASMATAGLNIRLDPGYAVFVVMVAAAILVASAGLSMLFTVMLATSLRDEPTTLRQMVLAILIAWARYVGFLAMLLIALLMVIIPISVFSAVMLVLGIDVVLVLGLFVAIPAVWAVVHLYFVAEAIVFSRVGPLRAAYLSYQVVRRNFWIVVGFAVVSVLTTSGLLLIWERMVSSVPGTVLAIIGNAFVLTGLALAQLRFYADRLHGWQPGLSPRAAYVWERG